MKILGIIPSRFESTRFPGKPLADIAGMTMIQRVYEQCAKSAMLTDLVVATDDQRIYDHVVSFGGKAVMTSASHASGTDRCYEALQKVEGEFDYVINIQGDEPFIQPEQIELIVALLDGDAELATLVIKNDSEEHLLSSDRVKVVFTKDMKALYFSREPVPHIRAFGRSEWATEHLHYHHVGIYGYRSDVLEAVTKLPKSSLEIAESLEQLRWLENGYQIKIAVTDQPSYGVDKPEDVAALVKQFLPNH